MKKYPKETEITLNNKQIMKITLSEDIHYYKTIDNNVILPHYVIDSILDNSYTKYDVEKWMTETFPGYGADDEIRSELISILPTDIIIDSLNMKLIEHYSGDELYRKYPIGNYIQHGDCVITPETGFKHITFDELPIDMLLRLKTNVYYKLWSGKFRSIDIRILEMGNASLFVQKKERHFEIVGSGCSTIFEAICWRNEHNCLPGNLS